MAKYLKKNEFVCGLCNKITDVKERRGYIAAMEWGSISGSPIPDDCCNACFKRRIKKDGAVKGRTYS